MVPKEHFHSGTFSLTLWNPLRQFLSRNMTSSSNLFEDNSVKIIVVRDNIESQDNVESNTEVNDFQEEDASGTNQTLSPSPSSNLFEDNNENIQLRKM